MGICWEDTEWLAGWNTELNHQTRQSKPDSGLVGGAGDN